MNEEKNIPLQDKNVLKRNVKDTVFRNLFTDKMYLFQLYQALHPEDTETTVDDLTYVTLENILVNDIYNDLGFSANNKVIILAEAQSTWSANIVIRALLYIAHTLQEYIDKNHLDFYSSKKIEIPEFEIYVIYTGNMAIDKEIISLSEEFFGGKETAIDVRVKVIKNGQPSDIIYQYVSFTEVVDSQRKLYGRSLEAIIETIRICKENDILRDYLTSHEKEVINIMFALYDQEKIWENAIASERREQAEITEKETTLKVSKETAEKMYKKHMSLEDIADIVGYNINTVAEWLGISVKA